MVLFMARVLQLVLIVEHAWFVPSLLRGGESGNWIAFLLNLFLIDKVPV